jgi:hypothetical protein
MAAEIKVTDAVVELALSVFINHETGGLGDDEIPGCMRAALEAGLAAMLEPVGYTCDEPRMKRYLTLADFGGNAAYMKEWVDAHDCKPIYTTKEPK